MVRIFYNPVSVSAGFTERHADRRLLRVTVRDLPEADGADGGGAPVSRRCRRSHRLLSAQALSKSPRTGPGTAPTQRFNEYQNLGYI